MGTLSVLPAILWVLLVPVSGECETCETSSLLQRASEETKQWSLSGTMSFSSPEFLKLLPSVDNMMAPISKAAVPDKECLRMVQALEKPHIVMKHASVIHSGIVVPEGADTITGWVDAGRKLRLLPLSFLASQNLQNTKFVFWANVEQSHPLIQEIFSPLMEKYGKYFEIKKFDVEAEFAKLAANYESDKTNSELTAQLVKIFNEQVEVASKSDLMRAVLLFNYGGAWMDSDVILVQDLAPLLEEDWAVLMYQDFVNPATLSVSSPGSPFTKAWLAHIVSREVQKGWAAYGPFIITNMLREIQSSLADRTFHVLPPCFFEGALSRRSVLADQITPDWGSFFVEEESDEIMKHEELHRPKSGQEVHLRLPLAQPLGSADDGWVSGTSCGATLLPAAEHHKAIVKALRVARPKVATGL